MTDDALLPLMTADFTAISADAVMLSPAQIQQAIAWSQGAMPESQQWQRYRQGLALLGWQQWLGERASDLTLQFQDCSLLHPIYANLLTGICGLTVGEVNLCLLATGSLPARQVAIPRATLDLPAWVPHLFVLVEVTEEQGEVAIQGGLRGDRLRELHAATPLSPQADWTYPLPHHWFDASPEDVLLWINCWHPPAIPQVAATAPSPIAAVSSRERSPTVLADWAPQLATTDREWWQILTWNQGAALFTQPQLATDLAQAISRQQQLTPTSDVAAAAAAPNIPALTDWRRSAINAGLWLQGQLDDLAQAWGWVLLPPLAADWRSQGDDVQLLLADLQRQGLELPDETPVVCQNLTVGSVGVRLYSLTWALPMTDGAEVQPRWSLVLIIGPQDKLPLDAAVKLQVRDATHILDEQILRPQAPQTYRYTQVIGTWDEPFWVSLTPFDQADGTVVDLPPFYFAPDPPHT